MIAFLVFGLIFSSNFVLAQEDENSCETNDDCILKDTSYCCAEDMESYKSCYHIDEEPPILIDCVGESSCPMIQESDNCKCENNVCVDDSEDEEVECNSEQDCIDIGKCDEGLECTCTENKCYSGYVDLPDDDSNETDSDDEDDSDDDSMEVSETVEICHIPRGNPNAKHTITVGAPALRAHLRHGDYQGDCQPNGENNETEVEIEGELEIEVEEENGETKIKVKLSNEERRELRISAKEARKTAREQFKAGEITKMELKEKIHQNIPRVIYHIEGNKPGRFLGIFKFAMRVTTEVDAETGEVIKTSKPWWAFLVAEPDNSGEETTE